jgi:N-succinyldiaminopimelate aminotransferase
MNPDLDRLHPYPFERLASLLAGQTGASAPIIDLAIGEPRHPAPAFILETLAQVLPEASRYPATRGTAVLREAIAAWLARRYALPAAAVDPERHVLPVNGTREALFAIAQCVVDRRHGDAAVVMPNPFYQIYEGAALLAGAQPCFVSCDAGNGYRPRFADVPESVWRRCQLLYLCSPANPAGVVLAEAELRALLELSDRHGFVIAADECYAEIYPDEDAPPAGLLQAAWGAGRADFRNCLVFHSLSKRSSVPGLRSGFVAGDADLIRRFLRYRTYHGSAMPPPVQAASAAAWSDDGHARANRCLYREKFDAVLTVLGTRPGVARPAGGFYLWPRVPVDDEQFAKILYARCGVRVLPGSYLGRADGGVNPGAGHVRIALVAELDACVRAARHIGDTLDSLART